MRPDRWRQIDQIFQAVLDRDQRDRAAFLDQTCAGDSSLRGEVESLIKSHDEAQSFIESPLFDSSTKIFLEGQHRPDVTRLIGSYKVIRPIGFGGMGTVYLASRADDQYRKAVAIKVIRRGMDTDSILSRFRHERQILASLDHPNIARLREGLAIRRAKLLKDHFNTGDAAIALGDCLTALRRYAEAESLLLEGYEIIKAKRGDQHKQAGLALFRLDKLYQAWGKPDKIALIRASSSR